MIKYLTEKNFMWLAIVVLAISSYSLHGDVNKHGRTQKGVVERMRSGAMRGHDAPQRGSRWDGMEEKKEGRKEKKQGNAEGRRGKPEEEK